MHPSGWFASLTHPAVRDLAWALLCPPLWAQGSPHAPGLAPDELKAYFQTLDHSPQALEAHLASSSTRRLGLYHEQLLLFLLDTHPAVAEAYRGVAVREGGTTLGEADFIYRLDKFNFFIHLEVAFKFFLEFDGEWLGTDPTDSLGRKAHRMANHQLPLSETEAFRKSWHRGAVTQRIGWIRGCRFIPLSGFTHSDKAPVAKSWTGWWLYHDEVTVLPATAHFQIVPRDRWLSPVRALSSKDFIASRDLSAPLSPDHPAMLARMVPVADHWQEADRGMVMPRHWPRLA
ncbi:DUF1853 family protein [Motiliproteus sp. SC1-56]|uniref:DUF1853 family protein n=1 Tax=Motiliproteus sp. SC1-56 TaxID=2799565 RepID=UPI001A8CB1E8|nr:DUF1853 family protein [Motiliproteus sp. SC1-56]